MKKLSTLLMILALTTSIYASNKDNSVKKQCKNITNDSNTMLENTYLLGIVEGIIYSTPYSDATDFAKSDETKNIVVLACKNAFDKKTIHGFDADYKWQSMKLISKKHSKMTQQF